MIENLTKNSINTNLFILLNIIVGYIGRIFVSFTKNVSGLSLFLNDRYLSDSLESLKERVVLGVMSIFSGRLVVLQNSTKCYLRSIYDLDRTRLLSGQGEKTAFCPFWMSRKSIQNNGLRYFKNPSDWTKEL